MSAAYDRASYAPKSAVGQTVSSDSTISTTKRRIFFATEWYWYPEGVKAVADRFNRVLAENELIAEHSWDEENLTFNLRCRAQDSRVLAEKFRNVLHFIIQEELKKGPKKPSSYGKDEPVDESQQNHYRNLEAGMSGGKDKKQNDEIEGLELNIEELLCSRLIRRLKLHEDDLVKAAQLTSVVPVSETQLHAAETEEYPPSIRSLNFKESWLGFFQAPLELEKTFPDETLAELKRITGCEFSKCIRTGTLYFGCNFEQGLVEAQQKLSNLKLISKLRDPCYRNVLYYEGLDVVKFVLQYMANIRKDYFATTLFDNLHLAIGSDEREDGKLLPIWGKTLQAVTVRSTQLDVKTNRYEAVKKVDISAIPTSEDASFKDWDGFKYAPRNEHSYLRRYIDLQTGRLLTRPLNARADPFNMPLPSQVPRSTSLKKVERPQTTMPRSASHNTIEQRQKGIFKSGLDADEISLENNVEQKVMRIEQWQEGVVQETGTTRDDGLGFLRSKNHVESSGPPAWDTYQEVSIESITRNRLQATSINALSKGLQKGTEALKHTVGKCVSGNSKNAARQAPGPVSRLSMEQPRSAGHGLPKREFQRDNNPPPPASSTWEGLADAFNQSPNDDHEDDGLIDLDEAIVPLLIEDRVILDEDISTVAGSVLQPVRYTEVGFTGYMAHKSTATWGEDDIIGPAPGGQEALEKLQAEDEVKTRAFHTTMNQKSGRAGKNGPKSVVSTKSAASSKPLLPLPSPPRPKVNSRARDQGEDPSPFMIIDVTEDITKLLDTIKFFRGSLQVQLEFGRIILTDCNDRLIWQKPGDNSFEYNPLRNSLSAARPFTIFTNVLSLIPQEMEVLIAMKNNDGKPMWQPSSVSVPTWEVTYEFHYRDLKALESLFFVVKIDGETFKTQVFVRKELGEVNVHGVVRHWDYRIAASGQEVIEPKDSKVHEVHRSIGKSLCIPPQSATPRLLWEMENLLVERFQLVELLVKRVKKYAGYTASGNGGSALSITECQSLEIEVCEVTERSSCIFMAAPAAYDRHPTEKLLKWWEASIHSVHLDKMLRENEELPLGDEPGWAAIPLNPSIFPALILPGCEMLKQMDGIGQQNRNGIMRHMAPPVQPEVIPKPNVGQDASFW